MVFKNLCVLVPSMKVALALEELSCDFQIGILTKYEIALRATSYFQDLFTFYCVKRAILRIRHVLEDGLLGKDLVITSK